MVMAKQHGKGSPKRAPNEPAPRRGAVAGRPSPPAPFRLEQCCRCDDRRRQEDDGSSSNGAGPLLLTLGPLGPAADRRCSCVIAPAPATMSVLRGSRYLRPAQELLGEVVRMADLAAGAGDEEAAADKQERLDAGGHHLAARRAAMNDGDGIQAKLLGLLSEVTCCYSSCVLPL